MKMIIAALLVLISVTAFAFSVIYLFKVYAEETEDEKTDGEIVYSEYYTPQDRIQHLESMDSINRKIIEHLEKRDSLNGEIIEQKEQTIMFLNQQIEILSSK